MKSTNDMPMFRVLVRLYLKGIEPFLKRKVPFLNAKDIISTFLKNTVCIAVLYTLYLEVGDYKWLWVHTIQIYSKHCDNIQ